MPLLSFDNSDSRSRAPVPPYVRHEDAGSASEDDDSVLDVGEALDGEPPKKRRRWYHYLPLFGASAFLRNFVPLSDFVTTTLAIYLRYTVSMKDSNGNPTARATVLHYLRPRLVFPPNIPFTRALRPQPARHIYPLVPHLLLSHRVPRTRPWSCTK